jgi:glycosyltransferase involved in cell wall biosynthesis
MARKKSLLFVVNDFNVGGAELFVQRLGIALMGEYQIYIMDIFPEKSNQEFKQQFLNKGFLYINRFPDISKERERKYWKLNALFYRLGIKGIYAKLIKSYQKRYLTRIINEKKIEIIHSHYYSSDVFVSQLELNKNVKKVITIHGDYNQNVYNSLEEKEKQRFLNNAKNVLGTSDVVSYVADLNIEILKEITVAPTKLMKIYLGYERPVINQTKRLECITFCMVARSNASKGWKNAVDAFMEINMKYPDTRLICVGPIEGILNDLYNQYKENQTISFSGYSDNPAFYIDQSDICLLPTFFEGESSPYSIIEYLALGKPVIATEVGEIKSMLTYSSHIAGTLIQSEKIIKNDNSQLVEAMEILLLDKDLLKSKSELAFKAFEKYSMEKCLETFLKLYS